MLLEISEVLVRNELVLDLEGTKFLFLLVPEIDRNVYACLSIILCNNLIQTEYTSFNTNAVNRMYSFTLYKL